MIQRAPAQAPKPTVKVFTEPKTPKLKLPLTTTKKGSEAFVGSYEKSPAKTIKAIESFDKGTKLDPSASRDDIALEDSVGKKRKREEDLQEANQKKRPKTGTTSQDRKSSPSLKPRDRKVRQRAAGLHNTSYTCYYNAILQTLVQTEPIREFCLTRADKLTDAIADDVVVGKHTTRSSAQRQATVTNLFEHVDPDDV